MLDVSIKTVYHLAFEKNNTLVLMEMKKSFCNSFIVIFFLILLSGSYDALPSPYRMKKDVALINEACKKSEDFDLCLSILKRDPSSGKTNIDGLGIIVLEYAIEKAKETITL